MKFNLQVAIPRGLFTKELERTSIVVLTFGIYQILQNITLLFNMLRLL